MTKVVDAEVLDVIKVALFMIIVSAAQVARFIKTVRQVSRMLTIEILFKSILMLRAQLVNHPHG